MFWTNQFLFLIWKRIFIRKRCGINSCITNTFFIDSWSSPANSRHCNCRLALGQLPQQGPQLPGAEKFCIRFFSKRELWNLKDCPSGHWHDNDMLGGYDDDMSKIWWYVNRIYDQTWWWPIVDDKDQMLTKPERLSIGAFAGRSSAATRVSWSLSTFLVVDERSEDDSDDHDGDVDCFWNPSPTLLG